MDSISNDFNSVSAFDSFDGLDAGFDGYWKNAERTNGRLAMIGLFAAVHNYAIFGWIIPGIA